MSENKKGGLATLATKRLRHLQNSMVMECGIGDLPIFCYDLPDRCDSTKFEGCDVVCGVREGEVIEDTCSSSLFQGGSATCKSRGCFNSSFTDMGVVECTSACQSSTFANSQAVTCSGTLGCFGSLFTNSTIDCKNDGCRYSTFHKSKVDCPSTDDCNGSSFYSCAVACGFLSCRANPFFDPCTCCDGSNCPGDVSRCTRDFCFSRNIHWPYLFVHKMYLFLSNLGFKVI